MKTVASFLLLAVLTACVNTEPAAELSYQVALSGAYAYKSLPICAENVPDPCASRSVVQKMHDAQIVVDKALIAARSADNADSLKALDAAMTAFKAIVNLPSVQKALTTKGSTT